MTVTRNVKPSIHTPGTRRSISAFNSQITMAIQRKGVQRRPKVHLNGPRGRQRYLNPTMNAKGIRPGPPLGLTIFTIRQRLYLFRLNRRPNTDTVRHRPHINRYRTPHHTLRRPDPRPHLRTNGTFTSNQNHRIRPLNHGPGTTDIHSASGRVGTLRTFQEGRADPAFVGRVPPAIRGPSTV